MQSPLPRGWVWLGVILVSLLLVAAFLLTPPGALRKVDYIAAAVCHRIPSHSFFIHEHQLPLCQRCTGTFPGALTGLLVQWALLRRRRAQRFPSLGVLGLMGLSAMAWGLDGFNSYTTLLTGSPQGLLGYAPQPWIRLLTGTLMGMSMSLILVPAFNQVLWRDIENERAIRNTKDLALLLGVELAQAALIYSRAAWLLYPVSLYSGAAIMAMFTALGAMVFTMVLGYENRFDNWQQAWVPLVWGLVFAIALVVGVDIVRFNLTGTMDGMPGIH